MGCKRMGTYVLPMGTERISMSLRVRTWVTGQQGRDLDCEGEDAHSIPYPFLGEHCVASHRLLFHRSNRTITDQHFPTILVSSLQSVHCCNARGSYLMYHRLPTKLILYHLARIFRYGESVGAGKHPFITLADADAAVAFRDGGYFGELDSVREL
jgi:hypothetical protein